MLIIGGGLAGLFCALKMAPRPVTLLAAAPLGEQASSDWAQGGIAAAVSDDDSAELHARDTVLAGAGLVDEAIALGMVREAPERIADLLTYGVPFDRDQDGRLLRSREAAHSRRRIVHAGADSTGHAVMQALIAAVRRAPSIVVKENVSAEAPIVRDGRFAGVMARDEKGLLRPYFAEVTVLATGGSGHLYRVTTNPTLATGAGIAIAARAGARLADLEFVQFHPTAIDIGRDPAPLATEALRGDGAILVDKDGHRFMVDLHPDAELAPRDVVARGVSAELAAGRGAFLDATKAIGQAFPKKFPTVYAACMGAGVDPVSAPIPVAPAAHYHMGGVWTDARGATSLPGLRAIGECASTGVHGANRLASNSLLEAAVFAARVAEDLSSIAGGPVEAGPPVDSVQPETDPSIEARIRAIMSDRVGVIRNAQGLASALQELIEIESQAMNCVAKNMASSAILIAAAAQKRTESRGAHARSDYPDTDPSQGHRNFLRLEDALAIACGAIPGR